MAKGANAAGVRIAPHPMLLALVAQFLENNGFNSSHRIYNTERRKRPKKEGWQGTFAKNYTAKVPPLETIFRTWQQEHEQDSGSDSDEDKTTTDSSEDESGSQNVDNSSKNDIQAGGSASDETSGSDSSSEDETGAEAAPMTTQPISSPTMRKAKSLKRKAQDSSSESESTDSEASSSGDGSESEADIPPVKKQRVGSPSSSVSSNSSSSDSDSDATSESGSASDSDDSSTSKILQSATATKLPSSSGSSSDVSSQSESSSEDDEVTPKVGNQDKAGSESSGTIMGDTNTSPASSDLSSSEAVTKGTPAAGVMKKHIGAHPTRLAQLSATADLSDYVSNNYVSYDYAEKAYRDLSITRGKGFTKEKNKKKRGSYRGGAIDTSGGKGFKFED